MRSTAIPVQAATNPLLDAEPVNIGMGFISFPAGLTLQGTDVSVCMRLGSRSAATAVGSHATATPGRASPRASGNHCFAVAACAVCCLRRWW